MPVMPSGRYVDIMSERARYHAARQRIRVTEKTPHHHLYPLIDILVEQDSGGSDKSFGFSGYTLANLNWIGQWPDGDRQFFFNWIREDNQVRTIEQARRRLMAESEVPREQSYPYPRRLYSVLRRRIEAMPMRRASATQWQRTLLNLKRDGLRQEELDWSGVIAWLARQPADALLEKALVLGAVDFSRIQPRLINELECDRSCRLPLQEVALKMAAYQLVLAGLDVADSDIGVIRYRSGEPYYRVGVLWRNGRALQEQGAARWFVLGPYGQVVEHPHERQRQLFHSPQEALQVAELHAARNHRLRCNLTFRKQYEYMSLHGGTDYREWLVTLPEYQHSHFNGHFYERNILLHIRSKIRETRAGERVLFIEEMQSDWQQASLRYGSRCGIPRAPFRKEWPGLALKLMLLHAVEHKLDGIAWADSPIHEARYDKAMTPLRRLYDEQLPGIAERLAAPWQGKLESASFDTRQPWLHAARNKQSWMVVGGAGKFSTRARYSKEQALAVIARHSKAVTLKLPMLRLTEPMRKHIAEHGLPLFGEWLADADGADK